MVSKLAKFSVDPNYPTRNRGAGLYYHRGNGNYSKYNEDRDGRKYRKRTRVPAKEVSKYEAEAPHKHDYKTRGKTKKTHRLKGKGKKGYF